MKRVCVFCGSAKGANPAFEQAARDLASALADRKLELVYGAGNVGLMGVVADTLLARQGRVTGVIPQCLMDKEVGHIGLTDLRVVDSMHTRKAMMADLSDAFIALPGGFGTLEELSEIVTWAQLGLHRKPIGLLNIADFYTPLLTFLDHAVAEKFIKPKYRAMIHVGTDPAALLDKLAHTFPPKETPWINRQQT